METIGDRIARLRKEISLSQKELADRVETTEATISRYENNKREPKGEIVSRLASALNTSTDYLLGMTNVRNPYLNSNNLKEDPASRLTDDFYALLIKHGVIKEKKELTPAKAIKILDMIFNEDDNNNAKDTED